MNQTNRARRWSAHLLLVCLAFGARTSVARGQAVALSSDSIARLISACIAPAPRSDTLPGISAVFKSAALRGMIIPDIAVPKAAKGKSIDFLLHVRPDGKPDSLSSEHAMEQLGEKANAKPSAFLRRMGEAFSGYQYQPARCGDTAVANWHQISLRF